MEILRISLIALMLVTSSFSSLAEEGRILQFLDLEAGDDHLDRDFTPTTETSPVESSGDDHDDEDEEYVTTEAPTSESQITDLSYELLWVTKYRNDSRVDIASNKELMNLVRELPNQQSKRRLVSSESLFFEDMPAMLLENYDVDLTRQDAEQQLDYLERLPSTQLLGSTVGLLADGACSAFLIGPRHGLTTASCVYEHGVQAWNEELDLYRGRNCSTYQHLMRWESVRIPKGYHSSGDSRLNWALITYTTNTQSPMWVSISYDPSFSHRLVHLTVAGYCESPSSGCLYSSECFALAQSSLPWERNIVVECGAQVGFHGGPILASANDYFTKRTGARSVYGISTHTEQCNSHKILRFTENTFWQLCHLVAADGHELHCAEMNQ